jgi:Peptidase family M1 domain
VTKVLDRLLPMFRLAFCLLAAVVSAQSAAPSSNCPQTTAALYSRLRSIGLDEHRVYRIRGAVIDRSNLHLDFETGTLAFTEDICGRITGAFFEGEGEILLRPPNRVERASLALFTGMAILEEQFSTGYLRFNDDTAESLRPFLSPAPDGADVVKQWDDMARSLAESDALRILMDFSHFLPTPTGPEPAQNFPRLLHARLQGKKLGGFEVFWDAAAAEALWAGQVRLRDGIPFWDVWTSFSGAPAGMGRSTGSSAGDVTLTSFRIRASVQPPTTLRASAEIDVLIRNGGRRTLLFELSRYLNIDAVQMDGRSLDFIHNQALEGTQLRRKGNDLVAVVFPAPLQSGEKLKLLFSYAGEVLSEAGSGLLYVGERGTWYPNFGLIAAQFDLEFQYPVGWTLVATGKPVPSTLTDAPGQQTSHWVSEGPIAVAGFNLGKYIRAEAKAGTVVVKAYGTAGVERSFPKAPPDTIEPSQPFPGQRHPLPILVSPPPPSPARNTQAVADKAARAVNSFSQWVGPYPFSSLAITQMPGGLSQGWPGLIFLSSAAFLSPQEQADLHLDPMVALLSGEALVHETAHQWWGDLVLWNSYRDQWFVEGLANYMALVMLEQQNPAQFRQVLEKYRSDLLSKNKDGEWLRDAGPVTLGTRLISSHFPGGYDAISYERGTWLFHMLRCMLRDSEAVSHSRNGPAYPEEPFFRALRRVRERYPGKSISTGQLLEVFEEELPRPLWYENRRSLDWFLEGWINGTAMPRLEVREVRITQKEHGVSVAGVIAQKDAPDDLVTAIPVYAVTAKNSRVFLRMVLADGPETPFRLSAPAGTHRIVLDPRHTVLTTLK